MKRKIADVCMTVVLWMLALCLCSVSALISPLYFAYAGTFAPIVFAFVWLYGAKNMRCFGLALILNGTLALGLLAAGEANIQMIGYLLGLAAFSELLRHFYGYDTDKGIRTSFLPMGFTFYAYSSHWWTNTPGSLLAALEKMPQGYAAEMEKIIENVPMLLVMLTLTVPITIIAITYALKLMPTGAKE